MRLKRITLKKCLHEMKRADMTALTCWAQWLNAQGAALDAAGIADGGRTILVTWIPTAPK